MNFRALIATTIVFSLTACAGEDVGTAGLAVRAVADDSVEPASTLVMVNAKDTSFTITAAKLHLRDIELDLPDGVQCEDLPVQPQGASCDSGEDKIRIAGPIVVDLVTGETTPSLDAVKIPAGNYDRIDFRVEDGDPEDGVVAVGSALDDRSLVVDAVFPYQGNDTNLQLSLKFNEDIRVEMPGGVTLTEGQDLVMSWVTRDWLGTVDIAGCLDDGDLTMDGNNVVVDDDAGSGDCSDIEGAIKDNMKNSLQLGPQ